METLTEQQLYCEPCDLIRMTFETGGKQHYFYRPDHGQTLLVSALRQARAERDAALADNAALLTLLDDVADYGEAHHRDEGSHIWLHDLTIVLPDWVRNVRGQDHPGAPLLAVVEAVGRFRRAWQRWSDAKTDAEAERCYDECTAAATHMFELYDALRGRKDGGA
ncbi:MAG: hypothetical protein KGL39_51445 [Patescibacteria group bacterium]|nr:hypothetical protein [Patescibacteria group bacterium]